MNAFLWHRLLSIGGGIAVWTVALVWAWRRRSDRPKAARIVFAVVILDAVWVALEFLVLNPWVEAEMTSYPLLNTWMAPWVVRALLWSLANSVQWALLGYAALAQPDRVPSAVSAPMDDSSRRSPEVCGSAFANPSALRFWRLLAELGFVLGGEFGFELGVAHEALRIGPVVFFAPVAILLELGRKLAVAAAADFLRHAMFGAPPAGVVVADVPLLGDRRGHGSWRSRRLCGLAAADRETQGNHRDGSAMRFHRVPSEKRC